MSITFLPAAEARARLRFYNEHEFWDIAREVLIYQDDHTRDRLNALYANYLVAGGWFAALRNFLSTFPPNEVHTIVNKTLHMTWYGNTLHTCAYWNTDEQALAIYEYLTQQGATPVRDYYEDMPWEVSGVRWISPLGEAVAPDMCRERAEFLETHANIYRQYRVYALPSAPSLHDYVDGERDDPRVRDCPLHNSRSLYTRNLSGHYSMYAPRCNGCAVGLRESQETDSE